MPPRRRPSRRAMIAGAAVLAVVVGAGAAALVAASGDDDPASVASTTSPTFTGRTEPGSPSTGTSSTRTETTTDGGTTTGGTTTGGTTTSQTETTPPAAPAEPPSSPGDRAAKRRLVKVPPSRVFSGTGTKWLGTIDVAKPALVRWSGHGELSIRFGRERFPVVAPSRSGQLVVPPYRFELVRVISKSSWQIKVTPQG